MAGRLLEVKNTLLEWWDLLQVAYRTGAVEVVEHNDVLVKKLKMLADNLFSEWRGLHDTSRSSYFNP